VIVVAIGVWLILKAHSSQVGLKVSSTDSAARTDANYYEQHPPQVGASLKERAEYYRTLAAARARTNDYNGAIKALSQLEQVSPGSMTYFEYGDLAEYYHKTGDKESAQLALTRAINSLPVQDDESIGYIRSDVLGAFRQLQKEYAK
jgi:tetratricopeptide (TPR) repeat protein